MHPDDQARQFFRRWHALHARPASLTAAQAFFDAWKQLAPSASPLLPATLDSQRFAAFAGCFKTAYRHYRHTGVAANAWRTAGIGQDELRNSTVLRWLLDGFGDHGQGPAILVALLQLSRLHELAALASQHTYWTRVESCPLGERESRIDIEIESAHFLLFIEVKVQAAESGEQLEKYLKLVARKAGSTTRKWAVIFLTPTGRPPRTEALRDRITALSWQSLAAIVDQHVRDAGLGSSAAGHLLRQFAGHMRSLG